MSNGFINESKDNAAQGVDPAFAAPGLPVGSPDENRAIQNAMRIRGGDIARGGLMGAAYGAQAAQGSMNPLAAFIQGAAAGLGAPVEIYKQKEAQIKSAMDATPFGVIVPEANDPKSPFYNLRGIAYGLASQSIQGIAQEVAKAMATGAEARKTEILKSGLAPEATVDEVKALTESLQEDAPGSLATKFGVPAKRKNPYYNLPKEVYEKAKAADLSKATTQIQTLADHAAQSMENLNNLKRARFLLDTGLQTGPIVETLRPKMARSREAQDFAAIVEKTVPVMRQGMPGAASDRDVAMFRGATFGLDKDEEVNKKIIDQGIAVAERIQDHADFMANWATVYGDTGGAQSAWNEYARANPMFDFKGNVLEQEHYSSFFSKKEAPKEKQIVAPPVVTPTEKMYFDALLQAGH